MILYPSGNGILIDDGFKIAVDTRKRFPGAIHIVTHAHWDHLGAARSGPVYANLETAEILRVRGLEGIPVEGISRESFEVRFLDAGHIVGSSQVLLLDGKDVLITGDFKLEPDAVVRGADIENVDVLVMDTTVGVPFFQIPSRRILYRQLKVFIEDHISEGRSVVLFGYSVGKSQELTAFLNSMGIIPYVLPETHRVNALFGLKDRIARRVPKEPSVLILPPKFKKVLDAFRVQTGIEHVGIFVSGWNPEMPISSHADWYQTVKFVEEVSPEIVVTYGENAERSAQFLKAEGFNAIPLRSGLFL